MTNPRLVPANGLRKSGAALMLEMPPSGMERDDPKPAIGDAFGQALLAKLSGEEPNNVIYERDDGLVNADSNDYFAGPEEWDEVDRWCLARVHGRVLDIGAGAGRAALELQNRGHEVTALDVSPGAMEVCRRRSVRETFLGDVTELASRSERGFDSFLMLGNNLGLLGNPERAARVFEALSALSSPGATIVGTGADPRPDGAPPRHASYHQLNREAGRMPGQIRLRTRFRNLSTEWFDLLLVSPDDLDALARRCGWQVAEVSPGQLYGAVLTRAD